MINSNNNTYFGNICTNYCISNIYLFMVAWLFYTSHSLITLYLAVLDILVTSGRVARSRAVECSSGEPGYGGQHSSH